MSTNTAFSARKPYPGCNIVQPWLVAAARTFGITKYLHREKKIITKMRLIFPNNVYIITKNNIFAV